MQDGLVRWQKSGCSFMCSLLSYSVHFPELVGSRYRSSGLCESDQVRKWSLKQLRVLKLDRCPLLTDVDIYHAVSCMPNLEAVSVRGSPTAGDPFKRLHEQVLVCCLPHCTVLPCCLPQDVVQLIKSITIGIFHAMACMPNVRIPAMQGLPCHLQGLMKTVQVRCLQCRAPAFSWPLSLVVCIASFAWQTV